MSRESPQSPCISVCVLDAEDICLGCYRSANEVTDWFLAGDEEKQEILQRAGERQRAASSIQLG